MHSDYLTKREERKILALQQQQRGGRGAAGEGGCGSIQLLWRTQIQTLINCLELAVVSLKIRFSGICENKPPYLSLGDYAVVLFLHSVWPSTKITCHSNLLYQKHYVSGGQNRPSGASYHISTGLNKSDFGLFYAIYVLGNLLPSVFDQDFGEDSRKQF